MAESEADNTPPENTGPDRTVPADAKPQVSGTDAKPRIGDSRPAPQIGDSRPAPAAPAGGAEAGDGTPKKRRRRRGGRGRGRGGQGNSGQGNGAQDQGQVGNIRTDDITECEGRFTPCRTEYVDDELRSAGAKSHDGQADDERRHPQPFCNLRSPGYERRSAANQQQDAKRNTEKVQHVLFNAEPIPGIRQTQVICLT